MTSDALNPTPLRAKRGYGTKRQAILEAALELFNRNGVGPVSTNHIAAAVGISPGNLYYHFKDKADIAWVLFDYFGAELSDVLQAGGTADFQAIYHRFFGRGLRLIWQYRFVFQDNAAVRRLEPRFEHASIRIRDEFLARAKTLFVELQAMGVFIDGSDATDRNFIAENMWLIATSWPDLVRDHAESALSQADAALGMQHIFHFLMAYMTPQARTVVRAELIKPATP